MAGKLDGPEMGALQAGAGAVFGSQCYEFPWRSVTLDASSIAVLVPEDVFDRARRVGAHVHLSLVAEKVSAGVPQRGFTTTVLLTLALGVGASTSIFSCVYGLLMKGLPFTDADRIVTIADTHPQLKGTIEASFPEYMDWRAQQTSFSQMAAYADRGTSVLSFDGKSEQVHQGLASGDFFPLLGTRARLGRVLQMQDNRPSSDRVAVLSATAW